MNTNFRRYTVFIIESVSKLDELNGTAEGIHLSARLTNFGIQNVLFEVSDSQEFDLAIEEIALNLEQEVENRNFFLPIIHLSCHGIVDGMILKSEEVIVWKELNAKFNIINSKFPFETVSPLHLCLSICEGHFFINSDNFEDEFSNFLIAVGSFEKIDWEESYTAFSMFYFKFILLQETAPFSVNAMNLSVGKKDLFYLYQSKGLDHLNVRN